MILFTVKIYLSKYFWIALYIKPFISSSPNENLDSYETKKARSFLLHV